MGGIGTTDFISNALYFGNIVLAYGGLLTGVVTCYWIIINLKVEKRIPTLEDAIKEAEKVKDKIEKEIRKYFISKSNVVDLNYQQPAIISLEELTKNEETKIEHEINEVYQNSLKSKKLVLTKKKSK